MAVESAIAGGSIALFKDSELVAERSGNLSVSRAEDLLPNIIDLLAEGGIAKQQLLKVAVSTGPGSYTGLRIGIASVMGLCRGLGIDHVGFPLNAAICAAYAADDSMIVLPMGKADICIAPCSGQRELRVVNIEALLSEVKSNEPSRFLVHSSLIDLFAGSNIQVIDLGTNLAKYVGNAAIAGLEPSTLRPIYVENPRFG
ncbi:MAG: tRNA (adenosine(37)-N6)-threonylcarbamoyltransferase complex dimerization subunit type 1 TsaB [Pyrinomonadaceae bacterium]